ncbi:MAG: hypothetical protein QXH37_08965, partial [Candidatus Bathyarchaeia archaeon]
MDGRSRLLHLPFAKSPAAITPIGSATIPNIHHILGFINLAITLPSNAEKNPIEGPSVIPSMGIRYMTKLRHGPSGRNKMACSAAKTAVKATFCVFCNYLNLI